MLANARWRNLAGGSTHLVKALLQDFLFAAEVVQLAEVQNQVEISAETGSFAYDDTAFGAVPAGIWYTLASCTEGEYVQLQFQPFGDLTTPSGSPTLSSLTASMAGFGALDIVDLDASFTAASLVTIASELPMSTSLSPELMLLRPTALIPSWSSSPYDWDATRTLWHPSEIGVVDFAFEVTGGDVNVSLYWQAQGWNLA